MQTSRFTNISTEISAICLSNVHGYAVDHEDGMLIPGEVVDAVDEWYASESELTLVEHLNLRFPDHR